MGKMRVNFAEIESGFEPLPETTLEAIIETVQVRDSKSSDNDYLSWEFRIVEDDYEDRRCWDNTSLSERSLGFLKERLVELGAIDPDDEIDLEWDDSVDIQQREGPELTFPEVIGLPCRVTIKHETYNNRIQNRVVSVEGSGGEVARPASRSSSRASARGRARRLR